MLSQRHSWHSNTHIFLHFLAELLVKLLLIDTIHLRSALRSINYITLEPFGCVQLVWLAVLSFILISVT